MLARSTQLPNIQQLNLNKGAAQMEFTTLEVAILERAEAIVADENVRDLDELRLAGVGGGVGEVIFG